MIRVMKIEDYEQMIILWKNTPGIGVNEADSKEKIQSFLERNKSLNFVAVVKEQLIATIMCGHDGRRGYIYHLAVDEKQRGQGIGKKLIEASLTSLKNQGIGKCHIMVFENNQKGRQFWTYNKWKEREDLVVCSIDILSHGDKESDNQACSC